MILTLKRHFCLWYPCNVLKYMPTYNLPMPEILKVEGRLLNHKKRSQNIIVTPRGPWKVFLCFAIINVFIFFHDDQNVIFLKNEF